MKLIDNRNMSVSGDMAGNMDEGSRISIAAACFSMYAYEDLKEQLKNTSEFRFLLTSPASAGNETGRGGIGAGIADSLANSVAGTAFEKQIRNTMLQRAIAKECSDWIKQGNVHFRASAKDVIGSGFAVIQPGEKAAETVSYSPINGFTSGELGVHSSNLGATLVQQLDAPYSKEFLKLFNESWRDQKDVKQLILDQLSELYKENSPELVYYAALYNIFSDFLKEISDDSFADENTGFKNSEIWNMLYSFQKDAALAIINKLDRYNGCILADSVGLGKTFTALAVIKYYESKNRNVLVLCPKKLASNWNAFNHNSLSNPITKDKLRYEVFYHTDLSRLHDPRAYSNGVKLDEINWGNYDLVVIDESHNFRNGGSREGENRYDTLLKEIIRSGVKTKVLMLSATPVNNRFRDLQNQLELAYVDGDPGMIESGLDSGATVQGIFNRAQAAFNRWSRGTPEERTTERLLSMLSFDFFELLDNVTIARSRKHIREYYDMSGIGAFPTRLAPISVAPDITKTVADCDYDFFFNGLLGLELSIYTPSFFILPERRAKYSGQFKDSAKNSAMRQENRETGLRRLMAINLMKRMESSIESFRLTLTRMERNIESVLAQIEQFSTRPVSSADCFTGIDSSEEFSDFDEESITDENYLAVGKRIKIELADMDLDAWRNSLESDFEIIKDLLEKSGRVTPEADNKLDTLKQIIADKQSSPINKGNRKLLIFTAFADTAEYLFDNLAPYCRALGLNTAVVTGSSAGRSSIPGLPCEFNTILTCFSPTSKGRDRICRGVAAQSEIDVLIGTDCISEGQNLQDCDLCVNYDIHWNPIRIIQRYGRIDRIGSRNARIQLINFWPDASLDKYIDLKRRVESRMLAGFVVNPAEAKVLADENEIELSYRKAQLERLRNETVDIEDISESISITDLGLNEFRLDLLNFEKERRDLKRPRKGIYAVANANREYEPGVIFVLKNIAMKSKIKSPNRLHPYYLAYVTDSGVKYTYLQPKEILTALKKYGRERTVVQSAVDRFNTETSDGRKMDRYVSLMKRAVESIVETKRETDIMSLFKTGGTNFNDRIDGMDDFEVICYLIVN